MQGLDGQLQLAALEAADQRHAAASGLNQGEGVTQEFNVGPQAQHKHGGRRGLQRCLHVVQGAQRLRIHARSGQLGVVCHRQGAKRVQPEGEACVGRCGHTGFGQSGDSYEHPSARPVPPEISALLTIPRHSGGCAGLLGLKALAGPAVNLLHLHRGQHARLKAQQFALVGQRRIPTGGEMAALPAADGRRGAGVVGGNIGRHGLSTTQVVRQFI